jgi:transcriptional regulator with XRE-family HTH domain
MTSQRKPAEIDAAEITRRREAIGLSKTEAARLSKMTPQAWHNIESGIRTRCTPLTLLRVARAIKCPMDKLVLEPQTPD